MGHKAAPVLPRCPGLRTASLPLSASAPLPFSVWGTHVYGICMQVSPTPTRVRVPTRGVCVCVAQRLTSGALSYFFETRLSLNPELNVLAGLASQPPGSTCSHPS